MQAISYMLCDLKVVILVMLRYDGVKIFVNCG